MHFLATLTLTFAFAAAAPAPLPHKGADLTIKRDPGPVMEWHNFVQAKSDATAVEERQMGSPTLNELGTRTSKRSSFADEEYACQNFNSGPRCTAKP